MQLIPCAQMYYQPFHPCPCCKMEAGGDTESFKDTEYKIIDFTITQSLPCFPHVSRTNERIGSNMGIRG